MSPAIAFRCIDQLVRLFQPADGPQVYRLAVSRPDEGLGLLINEVACLAGVRIDPNQAVSLVTSVDFLISEVAAVLVPVKPRALVLVFDPIDIGLQLLVTRDIEEVELVSRELIAGQRVGTRPKHGPAASWWRRLDQVDLLSIARLDSKSHQGFRIGAHSSRP